MPTTIAVIPTLRSLMAARSSLVVWPEDRTRSPHRSEHRDSLRGNRKPVVATLAPGKVGVAGFEPAFSWSQARRIPQTFPHPDHAGSSFRIIKCPAGVEPAHPPWQGGRRPLHHGHFVCVRIVKEIESTGWDSNPRRRLTRAVSSPLDNQCAIWQWDRRESNPHSAG